MNGIIKDSLNISQGVFLKMLFLIGCFLKDCCFLNRRKELVGKIVQSE